MIKSRRQVIALLLWAIVFLTGAGVVAAEVAVIAHLAVPDSTLDKSQLLDLYTGEKQSWSNDEPVVVYDLKTKGAVRKTFYRHLGKSSSRMKSLWMKRMLLGEGQPPEALDADVVVAKVAATPGAVGFVDRSEVTDQVKILATMEIKP